MWVSRWNRVPARSLSGLTFSAGKIFRRVHIKETVCVAERFVFCVDEANIQRIDHISHAYFLSIPTSLGGLKTTFALIDCAEWLDSLGAHGHYGIEGHEKISALRLLEQLCLIFDQVHRDIYQITSNHSNERIAGCLKSSDESG